jgi:hypothetical protein
MTRAQRRRHLVVWLLIGPGAALGLLLAITGRRPLPVQPIPDAARVVPGQVNPGRIP